MRSARRGIVVAVLALLSPRAVAVVGDGPPLDLKEKPTRDVTMSVTTAPARDLLTVLSGGADAPLALRRLRECRPLLLAIEREGGSAEQFFGRLVAAAAGAPDRAFGPFLTGAKTCLDVLASFDTDGAQAARVLGRRVGLMLPEGPGGAARLTVVPVFGLSDFREVTPVRDGEDLWLLPDLTLSLQSQGPGPAGETVLKILRTAASESWRVLFDGGGRRNGWKEHPGNAFAILLRQTVLEGVATLFQIPDEFFPLDLVLSEPIGRSFGRWNSAVHALADPKRSNEEKKNLLATASQGDFWGRYPAIVGLGMTDTLLRRSGRGPFLTALASGPREVAVLYVGATKGTKLPQLGPETRRQLEGVAAEPRRAPSSLEPSGAVEAFRERTSANG